MPATEQDVIFALHAINVAVNTVNASLEGPLSQLRDAAMQLSGALDNAALLAATDELAHALAGLADALATVANTFRSEETEASTEATRSGAGVQAEDEADDSDGSGESGDVAGRHWASEDEGAEDGVGGAAESARPTAQPTAAQPTVQPAASSTSPWPGDEVIGTVGNTKFQERRWTLEPRNATPNRLSPGRNYGPANTQMDCIGSNILKNVSSQPVTDVYTHRLARSWRDLNSPCVIGIAAVTLRADPIRLPPIPPPSQHERNRIRALCERRIRPLCQGANDRDLECRIDVEARVAEFLRKRSGPGLAIMADGRELPMPMTSVDRINNALGYLPNNWRLTSWAHNRGRGSSNDDRFQISSHEGMEFEHVATKGEEAYRAGARLPHHDRLGVESVDALELEGEGEEAWLWEVELLVQNLQDPSGKAWTHTRARCG